MSTEREGQIEELFEAASRLDGDARAALLRERCDDEDLRCEVEVLLKADRNAGRFLDTPYLHDAAEAADDDDYASTLIGRRMGSYVIRRTLGVGGMGVVFEAEQDRPRRLVALKVMRHGIASRAAIKRFRYEAEILGSLAHPNIAQVYDAGVHDDGTGGVPFFAMEHIVEAMPITSYAEKHNLSVRQKLELFAAVCDAIHHGHQKGVLHRDIKPANVLVNEAGQVKVIDFGVARATNADIAATTQHSDWGKLFGTVRYMSPEQCSGSAIELDTRSDVYSLGVLLYELLSGDAPYETSSSLLEATRAICEATPTALATKNRAFRGNIATIVHKAIAKEPAKRYPSASALASDIRRHLAGEPIAARPASRWWKTMRWVGRHPIVSTGCVCAMILGSTLLATWVSVWFLAMRPYAVELSDDGSQARLLSRAGHVLQTWQTDQPRGISRALLVPRPAELGGGHLVLIGYGVTRSNERPGTLVAYEVTSRGRNVLWSSQLDDDDIPESLQTRGATPADFTVNALVPFDVFSQHDAPQIVVTRTLTPFSQCPIRIYDIQGNVLYQAWHDGPLSTAQWLPEAQLLAFGGVNAYVYWEHRDHPEGVLTGHHAHPSVVFAIRPEYGLRTTDWISPEPLPEPTIEPAWYRCLLPPALGNHFSGRIAPPSTHYHPGRHVLFEARLRQNENGTIRFVIDEHGNEVREGRVVGDPVYRDPEAPDPDKLYLGDLPRVRPFVVGWPWR